MSVLSTPHDEINYKYDVIKYSAYISSRVNFTSDQGLLIRVEKSDDFTHP